MVSHDRALLRHLSKFLSAFGYRVHEAADVAQALAALDGGQPDFLLLDEKLRAEGGLELCRVAAQRDPARHVFKFLLVSSAAPKDLTDALEAGIDDFLAKPIVYGELLARLRAGARIIEHDRRVSAQGHTDPLTSLPSRRALIRWLRDLLTSSDATRRTASCVLLDVDNFNRFDFLYGRPIGDRLLIAIAERLREFVGDAGRLASFGGDQFAVLLPELADDEAAAWADRARIHLADWEMPLGDESLTITASCGVVEFRAGQFSPEEVLQRAEQALELAKHSGRDCVVRFGQFDTESRAWTDLATPGRLFGRTVARDVMIPFSVELLTSDTREQAATLLRQTGLHVLPVVDKHGNYVGAVAEESVLDDDGALTLEFGPTSPVSEIVADEFPTVAEDAAFLDLIDPIADSDKSLAIVLHERRPTGFVSREALAALSQPITRGTFAATSCDETSIRYLAVPEQCASGA